jgi:hypothetical protein
MKFILNSLLLVILFSTQLNCESVYDNDVYIIEQSINNYEFREIGTINLRLVKQNQNSAQLQSLSEQQQQQQVQPSQSTNTYHTRIESNDFDQEILNQIKSSKDNSNSLYRLRLCKKFPQAQTKTCFATTFTYLKKLIDSDFKISLAIHQNSNNRPISLSVKTSDSRAASKSKKQFDHLSVLASVQSLRTGQQPDTESYLEKVRKETEQRERSDQGENQSFFSKYWIYIVPFVVIMFLANILNPEASGA